MIRKRINNPSSAINSALPVDASDESESTMMPSFR